MSAVTYEPTILEAFLSRFYRDANDQPRRLTIVPFAYNAIFLALAPATTQTQIITIAANADFCLLAIHYKAWLNATQVVGTKQTAYCRLLITDTGSSESFTNAPVDLENYAQNDAKPQALPYPRLIGGLTSLSLALTNYAPLAETYTGVEIMLEGVRVRAL